MNFSEALIAVKKMAQKYNVLAGMVPDNLSSKPAVML